MNRIIPLYKQVVLCLYDLNQFGGALIFNLLKTHPTLLLGGLLLENPYFRTPDEVMAETTASAGSSALLEKMAPDAES